MKASEKFIDRACNTAIILVIMLVAALVLYLMTMFLFAEPVIGSVVWAFAFASYGIQEHMRTNSLPTTWVWAWKKVSSLWRKG